MTMGDEGTCIGGGVEARSTMTFIDSSRTWSCNAVANCRLVRMVTILIAAIYTKSSKRTSGIGIVAGKKEMTSVRDLCRFTNRKIAISTTVLYQNSSGVVFHFLVSNSPK